MREDVVAKFRWHAEYFDDLNTAARAVRRTTVEADNAADAEKIARAQMGLCQRVEIKRAATVAPPRVIYAREVTVRKIQSLAETLTTTRSATISPIIR